MPAVNKDFESTAPEPSTHPEGGHKKGADKKDKERDKKAEDKKSQKIEHKDAKKPLALITSLLKGETIESKKNIEEMKRTLEKYGVKVHGKSDKDIIREWHDLLRDRGIAEAKSDDWNYPEGTEGRALEEEEWQRQVSEVKNSKRLDDEDLKKLKIEDYLPIVKKNKVGTTVGGEDEEEETLATELPEVADDSPLAPYIKRIKKTYQEVAGTGEERDRLRERQDQFRDAIMEGKLNESDPDVAKVDELLAKQIDKSRTKVPSEEELMRRVAGGVVMDPRETEMLTAIQGAIGGDTAAKAKLEEFVEELRQMAASEELAGFGKAFFRAEAAKEAMRSFRSNIPDDIKNLLREITSRNGLLKQINEKFETAYYKLKKEDRESLTGAMDAQASTYFKQILAGWGSSIDRIKAEILSLGRGGDPMCEWRSMRLVAGLDNAIRVQQLTEMPVVEEEVPEKIANLFAFIESTDFSVEELSSSINRAIQLVQAISPDAKISREKRQEILKELEAFRAIHVLRITLQRSDMDPKAVQNVFRDYFEGREENVLESFLTRFERDSQGRRYVVRNDAEGAAIAGGPEELNLFDVSFELYNERLQDERIMMNMVEELTKYDLNHLPVNRIKQAVGYDGLPERWRTGNAWETKLTELRDYFVEKAGAKAGMWGKGEAGVKLQHDLADEWYTKKTLLGAFGNVKAGDINEDFVADFGIQDEKNADGSIKRTALQVAREDYVGKDFLELRRKQMLARLHARLERQGLALADIDKTVEAVDFEELEENGFLESVDTNAFNMAWMTEWSTYDSIRIYGTEPNKKGLDDVFRHIVFHHSTNMFFGRGIDHVWEFYHSENENRGRAKENGVNDIWKQKLPGKHHYLFPQNSLTIRWAQHFMTDEQKAVLEQKTKELQKKHDFEATGFEYEKEYFEWMRSVAVADMIENGQFAWGTNRKFSDVAKDKRIKKFEFIDVYADRTKHLKFIDPDGLQEYLADPSEGKFFELNDKVKQFYSTRVARLFPWMTLAFRAHWDFQSKHRREIFDTPNLISAQGETMAHALVASGDMERKQGEKEIRRAFGFKELTIGGSWGIPKIVNVNLNNPGARRIAEVLGTRPFRITRQTLELARKTLWEMKLAPITVPRDFLLGLIAGFIKNFNKGVFGR